MLNFAAMTRQKGFTLIELLIVIAVAGVLAAIGGPAMQSFIKNNRLQSKTHSIMADILEARSEAVTRRKRVVLCRSGDSTAGSPTCGGSANNWGSGGYLIFVDEDADSVFDGVATEELLRRGPATDHNVTVMSDSTVNNNLVFRSDGSTDEGGGTGQFAICDDRPESEGFGRRLDVPPHGRPKITTGITDCTP